MCKLVICIASTLPWTQTFWKDSIYIISLDTKDFFRTNSIEFHI